MTLFTRHHRLGAVVLLALGLLRGSATAAAQMSCNQPAPASGDPGFRGRLADPRIAYVTQGPYICRWHLERRDPAARSSDVVHPVTFLIDEGVPRAWHPAIEAAVREWLPIFDSLSFRRALVVRPVTDRDLDAPPKNLVRIVNEPLGSPLLCRRAGSDLADMADGRRRRVAPALAPAHRHHEHAAHRRHGGPWALALAHRD